VRRGIERVLAAGLALAGWLAAAPARCDPPVPQPCLGPPLAALGIAGAAGPRNNCVLRNGQWISAHAMSIGRPEPAFPPPGIVVGAVPVAPVTLHDSLSAEEREGLYRMDSQLARRLGSEGRAAALDAIMTLEPRNGGNVRAVMLDAFVKGYALPQLTPDIEAVIAARYWQGDFFSHRYQLVLLPEKHRYHSRALFELVAQELSVMQDWDAGRLAAALFNYDQPDAPDAVVAQLERLPPPAFGEAALYLLRRGDPRAVAVAQRAMVVLDGAPQFRDYYLDPLGKALLGIGTPEAYGALADLLRQVQRDGPRWDEQMQRWSDELLRAPRELHIELRGIDPAPAGARPETLRALATLLRQRPAEEALVTERTAEHLRRLIELDDVAAVREYLAQRFDVNTALDGTIPHSQAMLETLLQAGAGVRMRDGAGNTWLHQVCESPNTGPPAWEEGSVKMAQTLVAAGGDVNAANDAGLTPLMLAVQFNHPQILRLLLQAGARTDAVDRAGRNAMMIAIDRDATGSVGAAESQGILRQGGAAYEYFYRLRYAPRRHPLWCLAAIAATAFALGLGLIGIRRGIAAAQGRPFAARPGLRRQAWRAYFILCGASAALLIAGWTGPRGSGEGAAFAFAYLYLLSLLCAVGLTATGAFMSGLHLGLKWLSGRVGNA